MQHIIFYEMDIRICNKSLLISIKMNFYNEILLSPCIGPHVSSICRTYLVYHRRLNLKIFLFYDKIPCTL